MSVHRERTEPIGAGWSEQPPADISERPVPGYVVQLGRETIGMVVRHGRGYRFYATDPAFSRLEGHCFRRVRHVEHAAALFAAERNRRTGDRLRRHA